MPPTDPTHRALAQAAADDAGRVLPLFEATCPTDSRPREAIEAARAWARGEITVPTA
ncbi:putative immunity protein, partial [Deinococcus rhizophilus]|uniref:putative immunity protein n=1 Tax=Deinococcus rhizophilus TaxID=3049544 RepID=UPI0038993C9E